VLASLRCVGGVRVRACVCGLGWGGVGWVGVGAGVGVGVGWKSGVGRDVRAALRCADGVRVCAGLRCEWVGGRGKGEER
jgi:hypothetical protein